MDARGMSSELKHEKCAVSAVVTSDNSAAPIVRESLAAMQHRGPEASGIVSIATDSDYRLKHHRATGLVRDVFDEEDIKRLYGDMAIGHNRYSTNGNKDEHLQPVVDDSIGFANAHNGNLPVTDDLEEYLQNHSIITTRLNDSEMMSRAIAQEIRNGKELPEAIEELYGCFQGAFSCVAMFRDQVAVYRDAYGIRPLALGELIDGNGKIVTSETCGLDIVDATYTREVKPGELLLLNANGDEESIMLTDDTHSKLDMFEFVYFARPDSYLYGQRVQKVRRRFGEELAKSHPPITDNSENIIVVPIPDTSLPAAEGYASALSLRYCNAIVKNRYIGRIFMKPTQEERKYQLRRKHNLVNEDVKDKDVILIDDSIVRGDTLPKLIDQVWSAGAKSVTILIASPPVRFPDFYGIDTPSQNELIAFNLTTEEIRKKFNASHLGFLSLSQIVKATKNTAEDFNLSCFNGEYPIDIGDENRKNIAKPKDTRYME